MIKSKKLIKVLIAAITTVGLIAGASTSAFAYEFDVISDTHMGSDDCGGWRADSNLNTALTCISKYYNNDQCVVVNGDIVDGGESWKYKKLYDTINNFSYYDSSSRKTYTKRDIPFMYFNIGNHEYVVNGQTGDRSSCLNNFNSWTNSMQSLLNTKNRVTNYSRNNSYDLQYINGKNDRLAFLGTDEIPSNSCDAYLAPSQIDWLGQTIRQNRNEWSNSRGKKPMFVFLHQPLNDTVYGSDTSNSEFNDWGKLINTDTLKEYALNGHPEVIMFTGHTHKQFNNAYYGDSDNFCSLYNSANIFGVPSLANNEYEPEGYHVSVYSDGVVVQGVQYSVNGPIFKNTRTIDF
ncbi:MULTISPECIES: metallophosphoesterase [Clostridium]|uniref:Phosphohydrolase n=1 Tax=Clostridium cibarium TaxID=2762247 RepID=A0ABR8PWC0_9CLOT|nr:MULTISPECIES: metallophosphoesterase [Clostridium]MBD7912445.1 phosphohydrolase [Clostridium cibarium]